MKKILSIFILFGILMINACDPMEDIYSEIDADEEPLNMEVTYTFTSDDYVNASEFAIEDAVTAEDTTNAENILKMEAFNVYYAAEEYIPYVLEEKYKALDKKSVAKVTYNNFIGGIEYLDNFGNAISYELVTEDYDAMGTDPGEPGEYNNFSSSCPPEDYLPAFLLSKYPSAEANDMVLVLYKYYSGGVQDRSEYYSFNGTAWSPVPDVYVLTSDDYDKMGDPGTYNNFSSSALPENYLPAFLENTYTYAQAGDVKVVVYKYYYGGSTGTVTTADEYHYDGSVWTNYDAIVEVSNQFIHNGEGWVFDPTETITMVRDDYKLIVEYVKANHAADDASTYDDSEYYFGASYYYNNFDLRNFNATVFDSWEEALEEALGTVLLPELYPSATLQVNGVDMFYRVVFATYSGANAKYAMKFQVTKAGPDPEFTLVEGPDLL